MTTSPRRYPVVFPFREAIFGKGFVAGVQFDARVLAEQEVDAWWVHGVAPGALAATGATLADAVRDARSTIQRVLHEIAIDAEEFAAFQRECTRFFLECDARSDDEWRQAHEAVRAGRLALDDIDQRKVDGAPQIAIVQLAITPDANRLVIPEDDETRIAV